MGFGSNRVAAPIASWSADGKSMYLSLQYFGTRTNRTVVLPYRSGVPLERQYPRGLQAEADLMANPGARGIEEANVFPGLGSTHLVWRRSTQSNVYRLAIPQ
jgi:hypothetical protein